MDNYSATIHLFCPRLVREEWDRQIHQWDKKPFYALPYRSFFGWPTNLARQTAAAVDLLSRRGLLESIPINFAVNEQSFGGTLLISINRNVKDLETRAISGKFMSFFFEGKYTQRTDWIRQVYRYGRANNLNFHELYFWYATCPTCAKKQGYAQVVIFGKIV